MRRLGRAGGRGGAVWEKFESRAALRQRVAHVLVGLGEELLLFVGAGERVAAVVGAHVERGVHRVGEVSGLWGTNHYQKPFGGFQSSKTVISHVITLITITLQYNKVLLLQICIFLLIHFNALLLPLHQNSKTNLVLERLNSLIII